MTLRNLAVLAWTLALCAAIAPAHAVVVAQDTTILLPTDPTVADRIGIAGGTPSSWTSPRAWPGYTSLDGIAFAYRNVPIAFSPNAQQDVYYEISWGTLTNVSPYAVAYLDSFDPLDPSSGYLGDYGLAAEPDAGFHTFQVIVPAGGSLLLHFVEFGIFPLPAAFEYRVEAFSDADRNENFGDLAPVPEPATWGLMIGGFGAVGAAMRRRHGGKLA